VSFWRRPQASSMGLFLGVRENQLVNAPIDRRPVPIGRVVHIAAGSNILQLRISRYGHCIEALTGYDCGLSDDSMKGSPAAPEGPFKKQADAVDRLIRAFRYFGFFCETIGIPAPNWQQVRFAATVRGLLVGALLRHFSLRNLSYCDQQSSRVCGDAFAALFSPSRNCVTRAHYPQDFRRHVLIGGVLR
jgi:hypothetical protein